MKITVTAELLIPVVTEVEADSVEEAIQIAKHRTLGENPDSDWCLNETWFDVKDPSGQPN